jgi:ABC-2 type transport system ATP-binding protein
MRDMRALIKRLAGEGITVLLSSHLLSEVEELCNRVAIIRSGRIVYEGELGTLLGTAAGGYRLRATDVERARSVAAAQPGISLLASTNGEIRFGAEDGAVAAFSVALGQAQIGITALVPETPSLEELFLRLTEGDAPAPAEAAA